VGLAQPNPEHSVILAAPTRPTGYEVLALPPTVPQSLWTAFEDAGPPPLPPSAMDAKSIAATTAAPKTTTTTTVSPENAAKAAASKTKLVKMAYKPPQPKPPKVDFEMPKGPQAAWFTPAMTPKEGKAAEAAGKAYEARQAQAAKEANFAGPPAVKGAPAGEDVTPWGYPCKLTADPLEAAGGVHTPPEHAPPAWYNSPAATMKQYLIPRAQTGALPSFGISPPPVPFGGRRGKFLQLRSATRVHDPDDLPPCTEEQAIMLRLGGFGE